MPNTTKPQTPPKVALIVAVVVLALIMAAQIWQTVQESSYGLSDSDVSGFSNATYTQVTFERRFGSGFWTPGSHQYTLAIDCPGSQNDVRAAQSFEVSAGAPRHSYPVLLRLGGLRSKGTRAGTLNEFHPDDISAAWVIVELGREEDAEACRPSVAWDGRQPEAMSLVDSMNFSPGDGW